MAERLAQVARVRFPVAARPTFSVEKVSLFCFPASGGTFSSTAIEIIKWVKKFAVAKVCGDLSVGLTVHRYVPGGPGPTLESKQ
jgi:hypothetical protein